MVSKRALIIGGAGLAVAAIAIGLGVGLGMKKNTSTKNLTASQASAYDLYCSRRLDGTGRLLNAPTNDVDVKKTSRDDLERKLGKTSVPIVSGGEALDAVFPSEKVTLLHLVANNASCSLSFNRTAAVLRPPNPSRIFAFLR